MPQNAVEIDPAEFGRVGGEVRDALVLGISQEQAQV